MGKYARRHALIVSLIGLAFACRGSPCDWRAKHPRVLCYEGMADEGLVAGADDPLEASLVGPAGLELPRRRGQMQLAMPTIVPNRPCGTGFVGAVVG